MLASRSLVGIERPGQQRSWWNEPFAVVADYPGLAFKPAASMPAIAQISSLSEVSPETPTAPSSVVPFFWIRKPPGTDSVLSTCQANGVIPSPGTNEIDARGVDAMDRLSA